MMQAFFCFVPLAQTDLAFRGAAFSSLLVPPSPSVSFVLVSRSSIRFLLPFSLLSEGFLVSSGSTHPSGLGFCFSTPSLFHLGQAYGYMQHLYVLICSNMNTLLHSLIIMLFFVVLVVDLSIYSTCMLLCTCIAKEASNVNSSLPKLTLSNRLFVGFCVPLSFLVWH